jgi:hypothetical protein
MLFFFKLRPAIYLLLFLLFSKSSAAQFVVCPTCDPSGISSIPLNGNIQVFKCKTNLAGLPSVYKWGIIDAKGAIRIKPEWDSIGTVSKNFAEVFQHIPQRKKVSYKSGLISFDNKTLLPIQYNSIQHIANNYYRVYTGKNYLLWHETKGFVSKNPYDSITLDKQNIFLFTDCMVHRITLETGSLSEGNVKGWQDSAGILMRKTYDTLYLHRAGNKNLQMIFADSASSSNLKNQILLWRNGKALTWNFEKINGSLKVSAEKSVAFSDIKTLSDSTLLKIKARTKADTFLLHGKYLLFKRNNFWGYADTIGNIFIASAYDTLGTMYNNRIAVRMKNKWGFLDNHENIIAQPYYQAVGDYRYGAAWVLQNSKYNFLDLSGKTINSLWYDSIVVTHANYIVYAKGKAGLVNHLGQEIIGTRYLQLLDFAEGSCLAQTDNKKWLLLDYKENRISQSYFANVYYLPMCKVYVLKK